MIDLDELEELHQSTTPGPWSHAKNAPMFMGVEDRVEGSTAEIHGRVYRAFPSVFNPLVEADIAWIVAAHKSFPALLEELARYRALFAAVRQAAIRGDL